MATCDCEGSDRAYLIVNPGSPDRREILSLNPPICHDTKTKALLINGQLQIFSKEILNTSLSGGGSGGGVQVDWGGDDVDILPGSTWTSTPSTISDWFFGTLFEGSFGSYHANWTQVNPGSPGALAAGQRNIKAVCGPPRCGEPSLPALTTAPFYNSGNKPFSVEVVGATSTQVRTCTVNPTTSCTFITRGGLKVTYDGVVVRNDTNATPQAFTPIRILKVTRRAATGNTWTVTTNAGATSVRAQQNEAEISLLDAQPCKLTITFTDNTIQEIEYGEECPTVTPVECLEVSDLGGILEEICPYNGGPIAFSCQERKCPPETCCELDCEGGRVCCYGPDSGAAIDSFIRRT